MKELFNCNRKKQSKSWFTSGFNVCLAILGCAVSLTSCDCSKKADCSGLDAIEVLEAKDNVEGIKGLFYLHINDYSLEDAIEQNEQFAQAFGCSEVRRGNFVLRNLDWFQYDQGTAIVKIDSTENHLASLQVCGMRDGLRHDTKADSISKELVNELAFGVFDGMNSAGVYAGVNVVPFGQMATDGTEGRVDYRPEGQKDGQQYMVNMLIRIVLDKATSLEDAKEIIKGTAWKDFPMIVKGGFQTHWLIATSEGSFVCEFVNGKPEFVDADSADSADFGNIMTNFSNYLYNESQMVQSHGAGYERWEVIKNEYKKLNTIDDFKVCANKLFYSRMYADDFNTPDYFWTEWSGDIEGGAEQLMKWRKGEGREGAAWEQFLSLYNKNHAEYDWRTRGYCDKTGTWWFTTHSSIWDIANRKLLIDIEEQDLFKAEFEL